jgi:hypothetical protein
MPLDSSDLYARSGAAVLLAPLVAAGMDAATMAHALLAPSVYPDLTATDLARLLAIGFGPDTRTLRAALQDMQRYAPATIEAALAALPAAHAGPNGDAGYSFSGDTSVVLQLTNYDQIAYREATGGYPSSPNELVDLDNTGFTLQLMARPHAVRGETPLVVYRCQPGDSVRSRQWVLPGTADVALSLSIRDGTLCLQSISPTWRSGIPSDPKLTSVWARGPLAAGEWSLITFTIAYGGYAILYANGEPLGAGQGSPTALSNLRWTFASDGRKGFVGDLLWLALWKGVRTPDQVAATPARLLTADEVKAWQPQGLGGYWPFTSVARGHVPDQTTVSNTGDLFTPAAAPAPDPEGYRFDGTTYLRTRFSTIDRAQIMLDQPGLATLQSAATDGFTFHAVFQLDSLDDDDLPIFAAQQAPREARSATFIALPNSDGIFLRLALRKGVPVLQGVADRRFPGSNTAINLTGSAAVIPNTRSTLALTFASGGTYTPGVWQLILNGKMVASTSAGSWGSADFRWLFAGDQRVGFKGQVLSFALWKGARTAEQVAAMLPRRLSIDELRAAVAQGLGGYWPMESLMAPIVADQTPLGDTADLLRIQP